MQDQVDTTPFTIIHNPQTAKAVELISNNKHSESKPPHQQKLSARSHLNNSPGTKSKQKHSNPNPTQHTTHHKMTTEKYKNTQNSEKIPEPISTTNLLNLLQNSVSILHNR
jgi:hypothetical protein